MAEYTIGASGVNVYCNGDLMMVTEVLVALQQRDELQVKVLLQDARIDKLEQQLQVRTEPTLPSFIQQVEAAAVTNKEYSSLALRRTKAIMALLNCRVFQAHRLVKLLWESTGTGLGHRGNGAVKPQYEHLTIDQAQELLWLVQ